MHNAKYMGWGDWGKQHTGLQCILGKTASSFHQLSAFYSQGLLQGKEHC